MPTAILVFIKPPSAAELEKRLRGRMTDSEEVIAKRLKCYKKELLDSAYYDYTIVNDDVDLAVEKIEQILDL